MGTYRRARTDTIMCRRGAKRRKGGALAALWMASGATTVPTFVRMEHAAAPGGGTGVAMALLTVVSCGS